MLIKLMILNDTQITIRTLDFAVLHTHMHLFQIAHHGSEAFPPYLQPQVSFVEGTRPATSDDPRSNADKSLLNDVLKLTQLSFTSRTGDFFNTFYLKLFR